MSYIDIDFEINKEIYKSIIKNGNIQKCCGNCINYQNCYCAYTKEKVGFKDKICSLYNIERGNQ